MCLENMDTARTPNRLLQPGPLWAGQHIPAVPIFGSLRVSEAGIALRGWVWSTGSLSSSTAVMCPKPGLLTR